MKTQHIARLSLVFSILALLSCAMPGQPPPNSITWLAKRYGVSEEKVRNVATALGVKPEDMATYGMGDGPFPMNYIAERLDDLSATHFGQVTKREVEQLIQGYEVKCELTNGGVWVVYYLFYSTNITPTMFMSEKGEAMVLEFVYTQSKDGAIVLDNWSLQNIRDSGFEYRRTEILTYCQLP